MMSILSDVRSFVWDSERLIIACELPIAVQSMEVYIKLTRIKQNKSYYLHFIDRQLFIFIMINISLLLLWLFVFHPVAASIWAAQMKGNGTDYGRAVAIDSQGNVLVAGSYSSSPLNIYDANGIL